MGYTITLGRRLPATYEDGATVLNIEPARGETPADLNDGACPGATRRPSYTAWGDAADESAALRALMGAGATHGPDDCYFQLPLAGFEGSPEALRADADRATSAGTAQRLRWLAYWMEQAFAQFGPDAALQAT